MRKKFIVKWTDLRKAFAHENAFGKTVYKKRSQRKNNVNDAYAYGKQLSDDSMVSDIIIKTVWYFKFMWIEFPVFAINEKFVFGGKNQ